MRPHISFPVVGVGASAGGVLALEGFFRGLPREPGFAVVIVTHLSPERESHLHEIVARFTAMTVQIAENGTEVRPDCVYVLPSDAILGISGGKLSITKPSPAPRRERKPIDIFLGSLARDIGEYSAAVILSGGDGDGTLGAKAVKERGGITLAQAADADGPTHPDMPSTAISSGFIDFAVPAHEMGARLLEFARSFSMLESMVSAQNDAGEQQAASKVRTEICEILRNQLGHDFGGYKVRTFLRRVQRRMQIVQIEKVQTYVERLRADTQEVNALFRDLLINVTNFFRDADAFDALSTLVIPGLFEGRGADNTVRVWVPGCATGEEVYSIAILMREHMDTLAAVPRVQIFATDIDERALAVARAACYPEALLDTVSPERRERFFLPDNGSYVLSKAVRDLCIFSPHSVIRDPPFSRIDLVSCRNLLIYFGTDMQGQVIPTFHYSLRAGGYLFLGTSENVTQFSDLFTPVEKKHRIFRARKDGIGIVRLPPHLSGVRPPTVPEGRPRTQATRGLAFRHALEEQIIERFAPAHVVTDREGEIVYYSSRTGKYLEPATGAPTRQIFSLARKGLRLELRSVFREAVDSGQAVSREGVRLESEDGRVQLVTVTVAPFAGPTPDEPMFVVLFADEGRLVSRDALERSRLRDEAPTAQMEAELRETRDRLQSVIEEYETALEELKSSNEELVSVNEEVQSTNEELEASKEELQSLNEELHTVNTELSAKVEALDAANSDLQNLFQNTQVAMVFLDRRLTIRTFTPALARVFTILPGDRGRPLTDLNSRVALPSLHDDVLASIEHGRTNERKAVDETSSAHYLVRIAPYLDIDNRIDGAVATFIDITSLTEAETHQRTLIAELNHRVHNMLAVVSSIVERTSINAVSVSGFKRSLIDRLQSMSRSYELVSRDNWTDANIADLVRQELEPHLSEQVGFAGPVIRLRPKEALSLGMILHELTTNATKHGALSRPDGRIDVTWSQSARDGRRVLLRWSERGAPPFIPNSNGFGMRLIEGEATHTLKGRVAIDARADGLDIDIEFAPARIAVAR